MSEDGAGKNIFVIKLHTSYSVHNIVVTYDFEKGKEYVDRYNNLFKSMKEKMDKFYQNEHRAWTIEYYDMRRSLDVASREAALIKWHQQNKEFLDNWMNGNLTPEELEIKDLYSLDPLWDIESVDYLK